MGRSAESEPKMIDMEQAKEMLPIAYGFIEDCADADMRLLELFFAFVFCLEEKQPGILDEIDSIFIETKARLQ